MHLAHPTQRADPRITSCGSPAVTPACLGSAAPSVVSVAAVRDSDIEWDGLSLRGQRRVRQYRVLLLTLRLQWSLSPRRSGGLGLQRWDGREHGEGCVAVRGEWGGVEGEADGRLGAAALVGRRPRAVPRGARPCGPLLPRGEASGSLSIATAVTALRGAPAVTALRGAPVRSR